MDSILNKITDLTYFLRINRNDIINKWLESEEVQTTFLKHSLQINDEDKKTFYEFFDCIISVIDKNFTISECPIKMKFLKMLHDHYISNFEFFNLFMALKNIISTVFYEKQFLSFGLLKDLENVSLSVANELSKTYEQIQNDQLCLKNDHSNLLNEYKRAVDISNIVSKTNPKGIITYVNDKFCEISGYSRGELIGKHHNIVRHPSMPSSIFKNLWDTLKAKKHWSGLITNMKKDGRKYVVDSTIIPILDIDGDIVEYIAIRHDVTEFEQTKEQLSTLNMAMKNKVDELYSMTASLEEEASTDKLTGAFNRSRFDKFFDFEIEKAKVNNNILSMIIVDIDHFKAINDTYGHNVGDEVLKEISALITKNLRRVDIFARWGGEEFVILLPGTSTDGTHKLASKLRELVESTRFSIAGNITSSFGIGTLNKSEDKKAFFKRVDEALYEAKRTGRNKVVTSKN